MSAPQPVTCDKCGTILAIGDHPFCPHGRSAMVSFHDDIPGGLVLENYGPVPIKVYSHSERRRIMAERGLREKESGPTLGVPNPEGYRDLSAAAILARNGRAMGQPHDPNDFFDIPNEPGYRPDYLRQVNITIGPKDE